MKDQEILDKLTTVSDLINEEFKDWNRYESSMYMAYGPSMLTVMETLKELRKYFESHAKFEKELKEAYNEGWPDFVDGDII
jgi:hypothetical protein